MYEIDGQPLISVRMHSFSTSHLMMDDFTCITGEDHIFFAKCGSLVKVLLYLPPTDCSEPYLGH